VPASASARKLARRLLDAGIAHPVPDPGGGPSPREVTVVIPVRDRHAELARCLGGLRAAGAALGAAAATPRTRLGAAAAALDAAPGAAPGDDAYQVIVVDDCSADPAAIEKIARAAGARVIRRAVNGGSGAARNTGLAAAGTEFVAFVDSDCVARPGWLDRLLPHFADPAVGAVAPRIVPHERGTGWLARYEGASSTLDMGTRASVVRPGARVPYVPGAALVVRKKAAGQGFAPEMSVGEDVDFAWRLADAGWSVRYEPEATMGHDHRVRFRAWFARRADYGTSAAALEARHPGAVRPLYASWWTAGAWAAGVSGRPVTAAALTGTAVALLARRLSGIAPAGTAWRIAARLAGGGTLAAGRPLGSALSRTWWPVAVPAAIAVPKLRLPVTALLLAPPLLDWADRRPPLDPARYVAARLLDDAAYSLGVWHGCVQRRTVRPLVPLIGRGGQSDRGRRGA
jgi:mycofactocin system glycosyltransferase